MNTLKLSLAIILLLPAGYVFLFSSTITSKILIGGLLILTALQFLIDALEVYAWEWIKTFLRLIMVILIIWYYYGIYPDRVLDNLPWIALVLFVYIYIWNVKWFKNLSDYKTVKMIAGKIVAILVIFMFIYSFYYVIQMIIDIIQGRF